MTTEENGFLAAIKNNPKDGTAHGAFADWLDEHDRPYEAALQREKAGLSEVYYKIRRKKDGLFSTGTGTRSHAGMGWLKAGKMWRKLSTLHTHMRGLYDTSTYGGTAWSDVEVVFIEVRVTFTATLPVTCEEVHGTRHLRATAVEPISAKTKTKKK